MGETYIGCARLSDWFLHLIYCVRFSFPLRQFNLKRNWTKWASISFHHFSVLVIGSLIFMNRFFHCTESHIDITRDSLAAATTTTTTYIARVTGTLSFNYVYFLLWRSYFTRNFRLFSRNDATLLPIMRETVQRLDKQLLFVYSIFVGRWRQMFS